MVISGMNSFALPILDTWKTLGRSAAGDVFWERLQPPFVQLIDHQCIICTMPSGGPFIGAALSWRRILFILVSEQCWAIFSIYGIWILNILLALAISPPLVPVQTRSDNGKCLTCSQSPKSFQVARQSSQRSGYTNWSNARRRPLHSGSNTGRSTRSCRTKGHHPPDVFCRILMIRVSLSITLWRARGWRACTEDLWTNTPVRVAHQCERV